MSDSPTLPAYIEARIRQPIPANMPIVPNSTPVVAFGDVRAATVATLGLNPSRVEFLNRQGEELTGPKRRLETLSSLQVPSLVDAPLEKIERVFERCNSYFQHNPYESWFGKFNPILNALNVSFEKGTACHLDLVQWATDPVWGRIESPEIRQQLIWADAAFLRQQLLSERIQVLLLNGRSVISAVEENLRIRLTHHSRLVTHGSAQSTLVSGNGPNGIHVIGWTINLQSSFGVSTTFIETLANRILEVRWARRLTA